ncbi:electron transport complex subunit RsxC [Neptunitalea lumnitzerae]|uniref:Ion-translocating oxidoreductase complex subunit C n=1 Tax=Neptunitalea lumnitzerae TaxID=2965509 RepID=A0ABQ5MJ42_9FLAO|nr:electron transport complex subunit RsxC [Neptunitalea sp. Y10]GLB49409.1 hypothetical protein Y10_17770 [Neptunitalea sp. Y10]
MMAIPSLKKETKTQEIKRLPDPPYVLLSLLGYQEPLKPVIASGAHVQKYQLIAQSETHWSIKLHAPISGIANVVEYNGQRYLKITNDFKNDSIVCTPPKVASLNNQDILKVIRDAGIVGSGGAGFPTHIKYDVSDRPITHFIINGAECEPYLSADYALMNQAENHLWKTVQVIQKLLQADQVVLAIEKQHRELKKKMEHQIAQLNINIKIQLLGNDYPQGSELQLIKAVAGKIIPKGSITAHHGVVVSNIGTIAAIANALYLGIPYTERIVTISGEKARTKGNFLLKIGTPISYLLKQMGQDWLPSDHQIILGGPMMGSPIAHSEESISKGTGGVLLLKHLYQKTFNCIQCGYCADVCPQKLMPMEFARHAANDNIDGLQHFNLKSCIECGACAYVCPSDVPLISSILTGKQLIKTK